MTIRPPYRFLSLVCGLACVFLLLVQGSQSVTQWGTEPADIHAYRLAAEKLAVGSDPYVMPDGSRTLQYLYPPTFLLCFSPVLTMEGPRGLAWWAAMEMALLAAVVACMFVVAERTGVERWRLIATASPLLFAPIWRNLVEGQVNAIVILAMILGVLLLEKKRWLAAGVLLAFAAHIKVLPVVALPVLLAQRRWQAAAAMAVSGVLIIPAAALWAQVTGAMPHGIGATPDLWWSWINNMVRPVAADPRSWILQEYTPWNHSFVAAMHRAFDAATAQASGWPAPGLVLPGWLLRLAAWMFGLAGLAASLCVASIGRHHSAVRIASFGLALVITNLAHVQTWTHHLLALALLVPVLADETGLQPQTRIARRIAISSFAVVLSIPSALAVIVPPAAASGVGSFIYDAGRHGTTTLVLTAVWITALVITWQRTLATRPQPIALSASPRISIWP